MSETPIHDALHADWTQVRKSAEERGRLLERKEILARLKEIKNPRADIVTLINDLELGKPIGQKK